MRTSTLCAGLIALFALVACSEKSANISPVSRLGAASQNTVDGTNVIILVRSNEAANRLMINAARGGYQLNKKTDLSDLNLVLLDFERPPGVSGTIAINDMKKMEPSAIAELDHHYTIQTKTMDADPRYYAHTMVDWPEHGCAAQGIIGMIDGQVDKNAPAISNAKITARNFVDGKPGAQGHGTAIATLLVGPGRLKGAHLFSASVVQENSTSRASVYEIIEAINWMKSFNVQLVNVSLAGPYSAVLDRVIDSATDSGMIFVAAVGNSGPEAEPLYPAAFSDVIAVTAVDATRTIYDRAGRGSHVDFSAPGVDVFIDDGQSAGYWSGTSFSAPFVTAVIASDREINRLNSVDSVRSHMANRVLDLGTSGRDTTFGAGLVRVDKECSATSRK